MVVGLSVADCAADGEGEALEADGEAEGVDEEEAASGDALDAEAPVATNVVAVTDVVVLTTGAAPVVVGPHAVSKVKATTASPATTLAMGLRTITTPS